MSKQKIVRVDLGDATERQRWLEETIAFYAPALGLADWRLECRWNGELNGSCQAEVWRDPDHRAAVVIVTDRITEGWEAHKDSERSAVHELIHLALIDYEVVVMDAIAAIPDKRLRKHLAQAIDRNEERLVDRLARALVAVAKADRNGPPPQIGRVMPSDGEKGAA